MCKLIQIIIPGAPVAKGRHRTSPARLGYKDGKPVVIQGHPFTPAKTRNWEKMAATIAKQAMGSREPLAGPVGIKIIAVMPVADSWPTWKREAALEGVIVPTAKPDLDNIEKAAKDALNKIVWLDDGQVVDSAKQMRYGEHPGVVVTVEPLPFAPSQISTRKEYDEFLIQQQRK
jgi:Holliday junction resolvase RusA-like endonuclease